MFTEFWKSLGGAFEKSWLIGYFGPALVFWGGGLWVWALLVGTGNALVIWQQYSPEVQIFFAAGGLLLVFFTAILLESFEGVLLRLYEGYGPGWQWAARRRADDLRQKLERQRVLRTKLAGEQITLAERAELAHLDSELAQRPRDPDRSMPSRLGDILRTAEDYARDRYGLDPIVFWPRLYPHLSEPLREALGATQAQLDLALRLTTLAVLYGIVWSVLVAFYGQWVMLIWTLPALPLAGLLWRTARPAAISYAGLFCSAFDLHRFDVYKSLHWPEPASPEAEVAHGQQLVLYLLNGSAPPSLVYKQDKAK